MIIEQFKLDGKTAIVTGAARGLGQAIAVGLAEGGADIAVVDILDTSDTEMFIKQIGRKALGISADLSKNDCVDIIIDKTLGGLKKIDILLSRQESYR